MLKMHIPLTLWISSAALLKKAKENLETYRLTDFLDVVTNKEQFLNIVKNPVNMYKGPKGFELAATMIQKWYRLYVAYNNYKKLKFLMAQATVI
jgi:hypothetical protein